ncbi:GspE/PulE family protein [Verrucomicrobiota bacterium]
MARTNLLRDDQIEELLAFQRENHCLLIPALESLGAASEEDFLQALAAAMSIPYMRLVDAEIDADVLQLLPTKAVFQYNVVPVAADESTLTVAVNEPFRPGMIDALRLASGRKIKLVLSTHDELAQAVKTFFGVGADTLDTMMAEDRIDLRAEESLLKVDLTELDQEASVVKFVNQIIWEAHQERATDIHLEPMETDLRIRYRIDGVLHNAPVPPQIKRFQSAIISRIKVMANMDIAEKRLPQDGRISLRVKGEEIDVRVSTMPTVYGESVSLRLLLRGGGLISMKKLGLSERDATLLEHMIVKPHGILLVTGPTGSGKSTSLYAWLHTINTGDKRVMSAEDPIEYEMAGVNQVQMRPEIGLDFAHALRTFLRQDPDVIMVGEIRDRETAEISIRAALTGHLVFSTLHTNDAPGAVARLLDMGLEPFLVASSVEGIVAQRLVRRLCDECKASWDGNRELLEREGFPVEKLEDHVIYQAVGCDACHRTGFKGRTGLFEIMTMTDDIRPLVVGRASASEIKNRALELGMRSLRDDGWTKVLAGATTVEEVLRVSSEEESME